MQHTLKNTAFCQGTGLHSGAAVNMHLHPAGEDTGIVFIRSDIKRGDRIIPARWNRVVDTRLCTVAGNDFGVTVGTVEHLMAALRGCGVDNALVEINGPEVPVMDGSAAEFVRIIRETGLEGQREPRHMIRVLKEIRVQDGDKTASLAPGNQSVFKGKIEFPHPAIGKQEFETSLVNGNFVHDLADCRTFGFLHEVEWMRSQGLARGGSLDNAIVINDKGVMNPEGLRRSDEFIRHKLLDAVGDIYLAGAPVLGTYCGVRSGHALNNELLHKLFSDMDSFEIVRNYGESGFMPRYKSAPVETAAAE